MKQERNQSLARVEHLNSEISWLRSELNQMKAYAILRTCEAVTNTFNYCRDGSSREDVIRNLRAKLQKVESRELQKAAVMDQHQFDLSAKLEQKTRYFRSTFQLIGYNSLNSYQTENVIRCNDG